MVLDPQTDTPTDNFGGLWLREGAELPSPDPTVTISDTTWPQSSLEEVRQAQELGYKDYVGLELVPKTTELAAAIAVAKADVW